MEESIVRIRGGFSDRNRINSISKLVQIDDFSKETRTILYNTFVYILERYEDEAECSTYEFKHALSMDLATSVFCLRINSKESSYDSILKKIDNLFDHGKYYEILDFIEYIASDWHIHDRVAEAQICNTRDCYIDLCAVYNRTFEDECIGYRFVNSKIIKITSDVEIKSIEDALNTSYDRVNSHIKNAIEALSSKEHRDYKNCIVECSHALESLLNILLKTEGLTLGKALEQYFCNNNKFHESFKAAIKDFYKYASDGAGIRHDSNKRDYEEGYDEALLILVNTSGFINYLISIS